MRLSAAASPTLDKIALVAGDGQHERGAVAAAAAAQVSRGAGGRADENVGGAGTGDFLRGKRRLQQLMTDHDRRDADSVDEHNGGGVKIATVKVENEALLDLAERHGGRRKRSQHRDRTRAPAQRVQRRAGAQRQEPPCEKAESKHCRAQQGVEHVDGECKACCAP